MENNLVSLTLKEQSLLIMNKTLSGDELNIKCALLFFFYYIDYFSLNNEEDVYIVEKMFLPQIDINVMKKKEKKYFQHLLLLEYWQK